MSTLSQEGIDGFTGEELPPSRGKETGGAEPAAHQNPDSALSETAKTENELRDLDFILDIPLEIAVELGRARMIINELLQLGQGSVVELEKLTDDPMDIYVNGKLFARGEVVVVNEKFGIRLTDIISPAERVKTLG